MLFKRPFSLRRAPDLVAEPARLDLRAAALRFLDEMAVATFVLDREHRVIVWNKACARLTGLDATAVIGTRDHWKGFYNLPRPCLVDLVLSGDTASVGAKVLLTLLPFHHIRWHSRPFLSLFLPSPSLHLLKFLPSAASTSNPFFPILPPCQASPKTGTSASPVSAPHA